MRKPSPDPLPKEKGPSLFLLLMIITGYALIAYAVFNVVVNPILGLNWAISLDDSDTGLPRDTGGALLFLAFAVLWTLFWRFWAWTPVRRWMRAHVAIGIVIILSFLGVVATGIWMLDRNSRREMAEAKKELDSLRAAGVIPEDPGVIALRHRPGEVIMTNPTLDSLAFCINDSIYRWIGPMELADERLEPGNYRLAAWNGRDTIDAVEAVVSPGRQTRDDLFILFNVQSRMDFALLNYRKAYREGKLRENARESDFQLLRTAFGQSLMRISFPSAKLTLPYHSTLTAFESDEMLLKLVIVPAEWKGQNDKIKRYAIWSLKLEESRGLMQDSMKLIFMGDNERRDYIRDRLKRETAQFEATQK